MTSFPRRQPPVNNPGLTPNPSPYPVGTGQSNDPAAILRANNTQKIGSWLQNPHGNPGNTVPPPGSWLPIPPGNTVPPQQPPQSISYQALMTSAGRADPFGYDRLMQSANLPSWQGSPMPSQPPSLSTNTSPFPVGVGQGDQNQQMPQSPPAQRQYPSGYVPLGWRVNQPGRPQSPTSSPFFFPGTSLNPRGETSAGGAWVPGQDLPQESTGGRIFRQLAPGFVPYGLGVIPGIVHNVRDAQRREGNRNWRENAQNSPVNGPNSPVLPSESGEPDPVQGNGPHNDPYGIDPFGETGGTPIQIDPNDPGNPLNQDPGGDPYNTPSQGMTPEEWDRYAAIMRDAGVDVGPYNSSPESNPSGIENETVAQQIERLREAERTDPNAAYNLPGITVSGSHLDYGNPGLSNWAAQQAYSQGIMGAPNRQLVPEQRLGEDMLTVATNGNPYRMSHLGSSEPDYDPLTHELIGGQQSSTPTYPVGALTSNDPAQSRSGGQLPFRPIHYPRGYRPLYHW